MKIKKKPEVIKPRKSIIGRVKQKLKDIVPDNWVKKPRNIF